MTIDLIGSIRVTDLIGSIRTTDLIGIVRITDLIGIIRITDPHTDIPTHPDKLITVLGCTLRAVITSKEVGEGIITGRIQGTGDPPTPNLEEVGVRGDPNRTTGSATCVRRQVTS